MLQQEQGYHPALMVEGARAHPSARPDVRVGIVSWNTAPLLDRCLAALPAALGDLRAEIVVVDNASSDGSVGVARSHSGVEVRSRGENSGYAVAMNEALAGTTAPILIALNPDTEPSPGSLAALASEFERDPSVGLVVPALIGGDGRPQKSIYPYPGVVAALENGFVPPSLRRRARAGGTVADPIRGRGYAGRTTFCADHWAVGAVHGIRAAALAGRDPYCTRWFMYAEDIELCWRLHQTGWRLAVRSDVDVVHHGNAAGRQRWGDRATLELRSLPAIYDWIWTDRSPALGRATAATNLVGVAGKELALRLGGAAYRGPGSDRWHDRAAELATLRRYHAAVLSRGPVGVERPPNGS